MKTKTIDTIMDVQILAKYLGFQLHATGVRTKPYKVLLESRGIGFQGTIGECSAYLTGWRHRDDETSSNVMAENR